jgi:hypothetical protein
MNFIQQNGALVVDIIGTIVIVFIANGILDELINIINKYFYLFIFPYIIKGTNIMTYVSTNILVTMYHST